MFEYQKLHVYNRAKEFNQCIYRFLNAHKFEKHIKDQLKRSSFSIMLNIAEGAGRFSKADKGHFYVMARGSVFESSAILDFLRINNDIAEKEIYRLENELDEISKMLYALIKKYKLD